MIDTEQKSEMSLAEIDKQDKNTQALIGRRQNLLTQSSTWEIKRDDPDVQAAAQKHSEVIINTIIPESIQRLGEKREAFVQARIDFIKNHADELMFQAEQHQENIAKEQEAIKRLQRDLRRGFTTEDVVDRRTAALQDLENQKNTDLNLVAGYELLETVSQQPDEEVVPETNIAIEGEANAEEPIGQLDELTSKLEPLTLNDVKDTLNDSNTVSKKLDAIPSDVAQQSEQDKAFLADVAFLEKYGVLKDHKRYMTPEELHTIVEEVSTLLARDPQSEALKVPGSSTIEQDAYVRNTKSPFSLDLQQIFSDFADKLEKSDKSLRSRPPMEFGNSFYTSPDKNSIAALAESAKAVIMAFERQREVRNSRYRIVVKEQQSKEDNLLRSIYQAAFNIAASEMYHERNKSAKDISLQSMKRNEAAIIEWFETAKPTLEQFASVPSLEIRLRELYRVQAEAVELSESEFTPNFDLIRSKINSQLRLGRLVDELNEAARYAEENNEKAIAAREITLDEIPDLFTLLRSITSANLHKYNKEQMAKNIAEDAEATSEESRTPEQVQLLQDLENLKAYTKDPHSETYTPAELHELLSRFNKFSQKNRPDFDVLEDEITGLLENLKDISREDILRKFKSVKQRADQDVENRRGMIWDTLIDFSEMASDVLKSNMPKSQERDSYFIDVKDPTPNGRDLSTVFQLVADLFARDMMGKRSADVSMENKDAFVRNCQIINEWYEKVKPVIEVLPKSFRIKNLIAAMNRRLTGTDVAGEYKNYKYDAIGAINLQKTLAYTVQEIRNNLQPDRDAEISDSDFDLST